ncbi:hypothetical protein [Kurthia zopfii]|uniref:hypothetical protein n=1 Tax=Kurthia zopfii TaxID=1650 RepID=UPI000F717699|nr:hypothetical protein [Kurthia zopfii]VEI05156.1 Uncharacterised protein [Kurthia zopfii]
MKKVTIFLNIITYILSAIITIGVIIFANLTSVSPTHKIGGNGNFGLIGFFYLFPFIIIFMTMTINYLNKYMYKNLLNKTIRIITCTSFFVIVLITGITFKRAFKLKSLLFEISPIYHGRENIPLLTMHSNEIFFNTSTFFVIVSICFFISGVMNFNKKNLL